MEITYIGKIISLNQAFSSSWRTLGKKKDEIQGELLCLIRKAEREELDRFKLEVRYNSRHDADNIVPLLKLFVDCLRSQKIVKQDTKKFYRGFTVSVDESLKSNTFVITVVEA